MKRALILLILFSMNTHAMTLDEPQAWQGVTDQVMGGVSNLAIRHADGVFYMSGNVSTDNNGGFTNRLSY